MNPNRYLPVLLALATLAGSAPAADRGDLAREILRRVPEWPGVQVAIPIDVYEEYVRFLMRGPVPPQPPEVVWIERAAYRLHPGEKEAEVEAVMDVVRLPGDGPRSVRLLPADLAWREATLDGAKTELRRDDGGWFCIDTVGPGRYRVAARAALKPAMAGDVYRIEFAAPAAGWATLEVDSPEAWDVRSPRSPLPIVGTAAGTRGRIGLAAGDRLDVTWCRPQPPVHRAAQVAVESQVGWTLADGVHQVRAALDLHLWGGEASELDLALPPGADRVAVTGPDVREVQVQGTRARVFLREAIAQRTRLGISFESPRPATGRMALPAFGVEGATPRGGTLAIAGGSGGVLLEMDSPGLAPMALADLPDETRALLAGAPVYAYALSGRWEAHVDLVGMSEFPVRETLVDSALYTVVYRPSGEVMTKVIYEVRNRAQQYMAVDLPPGSRLIVARVAERQRNLARGEGNAVYVPLEKSVLTTAGLVSFPVELVYVMRAQALGRKGRFRLPLPRTDLPVAYARCAVMLPDGMKADEWAGTLRRTDAWSGETADIEFEYGTGHLAAGLAAPRRAPRGPAAVPASPKTPTLGLLPALGALFAPTAKANVIVLDEPAVPDEAARPQADWAEGAQDDLVRAHASILQGKNLYRAGTDYYQRQNYDKARELFQQAIEAAPKSLEADNARKYLGNIEVALGKGAKDAQSDRGLRATAKAVQKAQQTANVGERERQQELLTRAKEAIRQGDEKQAEAAYRVAVQLSGKLRSRGEEAQEQTALVREAQRFLTRQEGRRKEEREKVAELQQQVQSLKESIAQTGGQQFGEAVDALVLADTDEAGTAAKWDMSAPAPGLPREQARPQVEMNVALAEQQVAAGSGVVARGSGRSMGFVGGAYAGYGAVGGKEAALKKQVEELKSIKSQLAPDAATHEASRGGLAPAPKPVQVDLGRRVAEKAKVLKSQAGEATDLARQGRLAEARQLVERLEGEAKAADSAALALTGLGTLRADVPAVRVATGDADGRVTEDAVTYLRYPSAAEWQATQAAQKAFAGELEDLRDVRKSLSEAKQALEHGARELDRVRFFVNDVAAGEEGGRKLAEFIGANYGWEFRAGQGGGGAANDAAAQAGATTVDFSGDAGGLLNLAGTGAPEGVQALDGNLVVANDPASVSRVQAVLEHLRTNLGQRVPVASRNLFVNGRAAEVVGVRWQAGANGVHYAVVNEGQLLGLMDVEQRTPTAGPAGRPPRDAYQDAIVGTDARLANGVVVTVARAGDAGNTLTYNGNAVEVPHDDYVVIDNGTYVTAVRSGRMQHWAAEAAPVRFPGVPAAVVVPTVGHTVKFEKTLLDASDALELVADYTWEGEER